MKSAIVFLGFLAVSSAVKWNVTDTTKSTTCIVLEASSVVFKLNVMNTQNETVPITVNINDTAIPATGNCFDSRFGEPAQSLVVKFFPENRTAVTAKDPWVMSLWFATNEKQGVAFKLVDYELKIFESALFNNTEETFNKSTTAELDVQAEEKNGFKCSTSGLALTSESTIELKDVRVIAQAALPSPDFPKEQTFEQCLLDTRTSDVVPIVVGACLAGLVVIVLVAYLIGRARAKRQGYASV